MSFLKFMLVNNNENGKHSALVVYSDHVSPWVHEIYKVYIPHLKWRKVEQQSQKEIRET